MTLLLHRVLWVLLLLLALGGRARSFAAAASAPRVVAVGGHGPGRLEHLSPGDDRACPPDARRGDLVPWQTTLVVPALGTTAPR